MDFIPEKHEVLLKGFPSGNLGIDHKLKSEELIDDFYRNQFNIKILIKNRKILAIAVYKAIEIKALIEEEFPEVGCGYFYIEYLAVDKEFQGISIGTRFLEYLLEDCNVVIKKLNLRGVALSAAEEAKEFYQKVGFKLITNYEGKLNLMLLDTNVDMEAYNNRFDFEG